MTAILTALKAKALVKQTFTRAFSGLDGTNELDLTTSIIVRYIYIFAISTD
jgi:hypothetical protein